MDNLANPTFPESVRRKSAKLKSVVLKVDMTPMVDLGFLLISFFVFTAQLSKPVVAKLFVPAAGWSSAVADRNALTLMLSQEKVFAYQGNWEDASARGLIKETNYSYSTGIGRLIRDKQLELDGIPGANRNDLVLLIKPLDQAAYGNLIDVLDEVIINKVSRYVLMDISDDELKYTNEMGSMRTKF